MNLYPLFNPSSIIHVGASSDFTKLSGRPLRFLLEAKFPGPIYPVNAARSEIAGIKCYPSVSDVPGPVDLAIITLAAPAVPAALAECARIGVKAAVIISGGFAEIGGEGARLQEEIVKIAREHNIAVCGPNCSGLVNASRQIPVTFSGAMERGMPLKGSIAMAGQSGALSTAILGAAKDANLGFTYWVSVGNEAVVDINDYTSFFLQDPETKVVIGYLEEIRNGDKFKRCARQALEAGKPLVFMKVGRTASGAKAALSHTGAMARPDELYRALFSQLGVVRAYTLDELLDYARIFSAGKWPKGRKTLILTASGGAGALMSDACDEAGLDMVEVSSEMAQRVGAALGNVASIINVTNPVDFSAELLARPNLLKQVLSVLANDPDVDILLIYLTFFQGGAEYDVTRELINIARGAPDKLLVVAWFPMPGGEIQRMLGENGIPCFPEPVRAVKAIAQLVKYGAFRESFLADAAVATLPVAGLPKEGALAEALLAGKGPCLDEVEAKALLKSYGFSIPAGEVVASGGRAVEVAREVGYPVVLKVVSGAVLHKSDVGGVKVGINGNRELEEAYLDLVARFGNQEAFRGILVEKMVTGAQEAMLGLKFDPALGPMLSFGLGGIFVEIFKDIVFLPVPFTRREAEEKIKETYAYRLLSGYRGGTVFDLQALLDDLKRLEALARDLAGRVVELDINPLMILPEGQGTVVADALVVLAQ